jgi:hypothetical protein
MRISSPKMQIADAMPAGHSKRDQRSVLSSSPIRCSRADTIPGLFEARKFGHAKSGLTAFRFLIRPYSSMDRTEATGRHHPPRFPKANGVFYPKLSGVRRTLLYSGMRRYCAFPISSGIVPNRPFLRPWVMKMDYTFSPDSFPSSNDQAQPQRLLMRQFRATYLQSEFGQKKRRSPIRYGR